MASQTESKATDTMSSLYPGRPIRPLPKRRLRDRVPPDVLESIQSPPPQTAQPLFCYAYHGRVNGADADPSMGFQRSGMSATDSDDDEEGKAGSAAWPSAQAGDRPGRQDSNDKAGISGNLLPSTSSSTDGYDSFENTKNKKKRKVPSPGDYALFDGFLPAEINNLPIMHRQGHDYLTGTGASGAHGGSGCGVFPGGQGLSGPGRGRFSRRANGRYPLGGITDICNNWAGRAVKNRSLDPAALNSDKVTTDRPGIISDAIASAHAERLPPATSQEHASLFQQANQPRSSPVFTFTCESQLSGPWPMSTVSNSVPNTGLKSATAQNMHSGQANLPRISANIDRKAGGQAGEDCSDTPSHKIRSKILRKQRLDRDLQKQAEERRREALMRPRGDNDYICIICEYVMVFGELPYATIRRYEIKDRQRRRAEAEKKRLLEEARKRTRKPRQKTPGKVPAKDNGTNHAHCHEAQAEHGDLNHDQAADLAPDHEHHDDGTELFEDDGDDGVDYDGCGRDEALDNHANSGPAGGSTSGYNIHAAGTNASNGAAKMCSCTYAS